MAIPKYLTLKEWEGFFEGRIPASTLRAEIHAGRLRCVRARPGCNAPILISDTEMERWLKEVAGKRQMALSPTEAAAANAAGGDANAS
ncbi:MAG: hypothetical protein KDB90_12025 [Planctomycetes bacterium]|nr:hypothetical protein [Planctomycetota bacterium]